ncbi:MAG: glycoside hydrolase family 13 protein [Dermatophilaceae bacterium]
MRERVAGPAASFPWWRDAVVYQVYPRSFADADGDGCGDLAGVTSRLEYLADLGVDALWLSPFYPSPLADGGYDVVDYRAVDPRYGTLADAEALLSRAGTLGLRVIVDLVPNHSSDEHPWFQAALRAGPGSSERGCYLFRDGRGRDGSRPPNTWMSVFGGPAWTRVTEADGRPGQWYLHLFDAKQPDFDWTSEQVREEFRSILRFWLDRGVAGFRVDVAHGLVKPAELGRETRVRGRARRAPARQDPSTADAPGTGIWDQDGVHEIYRDWRRLLDGYGEPDRILCGEAWVSSPHRLARYVRPGEMHQAFTFDLLTSPWDAGALRRAVDRSLAAMGAVAAPCTWVLSSHDAVRHASRLALPPGRQRDGIRATDPQPDRLLGLRRARAATMLMLALPGAACLYQGEELGLPDHTTLPDTLRQDPAYLRSGGEVTGRDGARVPLPWRAGEPGFGFGPGGRTWLPQPARYGEYAVDRQQADPGSTLALYRRLLVLRRHHRLGLGTLTWDEARTRGRVLAFTTGTSEHEPVTVLVNLGRRAVQLPPDARVLVSSEPLTPSGAVGTDVAVWMTRPG